MPDETEYTFTPRAALAFGFGYVDEIGTLGRRRGLAHEEASAAVKVAEFLMSWQAEGEIEAAAEDAPEDYIAGGPVRQVQCALDACDVAQVVATANGYIGLRVVPSGNEEASIGVVLTPVLARQFAAGILNACDEADGTTPLTFTPRA